MAKYDPLYRFLHDGGQATVDLGFEAIAGMVEGGLPPSAFDPKRRMWWSNTADERHVQAAAWRRAGYAGQSVDFAERRVRFSRGR